MGDALDEPVVLIKCAWGGKSLAVDFRPPSAGGLPESFDARTREAIAQDPAMLGKHYRETLDLTRAALAKLAELFPALRGRGHELAGFGWHQGWNDGCAAGMTNEYEVNLVNLIRDVRKDLGVKDLPFVVADSGFGGENQKVDRRLKIREAQAGPAKLPEFKDNFRCVKTAGFFRAPDVSPSGQGYHWNGNAETYYLIGESMGEAMKELCKP
jgi:alpha-galactosidase